MSTEVERAMEIYDEARQAEEQKQFDAAEKYYVKSANLFQQIGGTHFINAAHALNALSSLREGRGDYNGALCSAKHSVGSWKYKPLISQAATQTKFVCKPGD